METILEAKTTLENEILLESYPVHTYKSQMHIGKETGHP